MPGARAFTFQPGTATPADRSTWDIGSAGSTTMLALLPLLAVGTKPVQVELPGGVFHDFARRCSACSTPAAAACPLGASVRAEMIRPGYVPSGGGILRLAVDSAPGSPRPLRATRRRDLQRIWEISPSSHLARHTLQAAGLHPEIQRLEDTSALQPGWVRGSSSSAGSARGVTR